MSPTIHERPVRRDPRSGLIEIQPAYEGWRPRQADRGWILVLAGAALVALALYGLGRA